jgi:transmembrane sensor
MTEAEDGRDDELFSEANAWFHRLRAEDATDADRQAFERWLAQGAAQARAWDEVQSLILAAREPASVVREALRKERNVAAANDDRAVAAARRPAWGSRFGHAAAALAALLIVVGAAHEGPILFDRLTADYATTAGERRTVSLADGSKVELNTNTSLRVDFADGQRRLTLLRGEAWFDVKHDPAHPFTVAAGNGETRDIGTRFSVALVDGVATVEVAEGLVAVTGGPSPGSTTQVAPGRAVSYSAAGFSDVHAIDPAVAFAWRQGQIVFRQQPLSQVVAELNRYRAGRIVILDAAAADRMVSGTFEIDQPAAVLDALEKTLGVKAISITPYLVLLR